MKRGGALERKVPLRAKTPLVNRTELKRTTPLPAQSVPLARTPMVRAVKRTGPVVSVRALVFARDCRCCVVCGAPATEQHHRQPRGAGGSSDPAINSPANLLSVCTAHHRVIESLRTAAEQRGYIVRRPTDPATVPVQIHGAGLVLLDHAGNRTPTTKARDAA